MQRPRLRDNQNLKSFELYPLGILPDGCIYSIGKWLAYYFAVGKNDISGEDWGDIFAKGIDGEHLGSPLGLADVIYEGMAWSVKSVKNDNPHKCKHIRVISGRCSPDYSYNITNPHEDIDKTGIAVLNIWNERVNVAKDKYEPLRSTILIRNPNTLDFTIFENEVFRFNTQNYKWKVNTRGNLEGFDITTKKHIFTWQPHGSQFTILYDVPLSAKKFHIKRPPVLDFHKTMEQIGFDKSWIKIID